MVIHIMVKNNKIANAFLFQSPDLKGVLKSKRLQDICKNLNYCKRYNAFAKNKDIVFQCFTQKSVCKVVCRNSNFAKQTKWTLQPFSFARKTTLQCFFNYFANEKALYYSTITISCLQLCLQKHKINNIKQ